MQRNLFLSPVFFLCATLATCLSACAEEPAKAPPAKPAVRVFSDWSEWKKQDTGEEAKIEIVKSLPETNPSPKASERPPLSPEAEKAGVLILGRGSPMTVVRYEGKEEIPLTDYEISWEGMRIDGNDFFAALTFPVGKKDRCATFITGGWGGYVVGVSSIGHMFANENQTTGSVEFEKGRWYSFTLQVTNECLRALIDGKEQFKADIREQVISMHPSEIQKAMPLGFASYDTRGAIRNVRLRKLEPGELKPDDLDY